MNRDCEQVAQYVADEILRKAKGPAMRPETWVTAGDRFGCLMLGHRLDALPPGQYYTRQGARWPVICFNRSLPPDLLCYVLVHEIAHHVQMTETMESLFGHVTVYGYFSAEGLRDQIARRVESLVFPGYRRSARVRRFLESGRVAR